MSDFTEGRLSRLVSPLFRTSLYFNPFLPGVRCDYKRNQGYSCVSVDPCTGSESFIACTLTLVFLLPETESRVYNTQWLPYLQIFISSMPILYSDDVISSGSLSVSTTSHLSNSRISSLTSSLINRADV